MDKNLKTRILVILGTILVSLYFIFPIGKRINLGLDLKGGMHLTLRVESEKLPAKDRNDAVLRAIEILRNRIDGLGVGETSIQREGEDRIIVQLPGITDRESALEMIGKVAQLEFKIVNNDADLLKQALDGKVSPEYVLKYTKEDKRPILIEAKTSLKGEAISDAKVDIDSSGFNQPRISLAFNAKGARQFAELTRKHVGDQLAIVLDGEVLSAPRINGPILDGRAEITGQFSFDEASLLSLALRSGSLPAPMIVEEERTIGPLLGQDSIRSGIHATILGFALVVLFMAIYYHLSGVIADVALVLNLLMLLGTMGLLKALMPGIPVTLTLPGIAGIILTLGMAVDANVLINERIREELDVGRPLPAAVANGYDKAFTAIFDCHLTNFIASAILFQFGSGPIKGFAVTLFIGLAASFFTSLYVTRTILMILLKYRMITSLSMVKLLTKTKIDFVKWTPYWVVLSVILISAGMFDFFHKGEKVYGIDFAGGQIQEYQFKKAVDVEGLRKILKADGISDAVIQNFPQHPETIIVRTSTDTFDLVQKSLKEKMADNTFEIRRIEKVGPVVGKTLRERAVWAIVLSLVGILIYVAFRFRHLDFAVAGVLALAHDVIIALGFVALSGRQVDLLVITALMTIAGYSISDTIVIYDRIRENMPKYRKMGLRDLINMSINQTLSRTLLTVGVTMLAVIALFFWGGEVLNTFSFCLLVGFIAGSYSSIFIAAPIVLLWSKHK